MAVALRKPDFEQRAMVSGARDREGGRRETTAIGKRQSPGTERPPESRAAA